MVIGYAGDRWNKKTRADLEGGLDPGLICSTTRGYFVYVLLSVVSYPFVTITECDFDLASDLAVLARDNEFDSSEMIIGEAVIENLEDPVDATIEFSFFRFGVVGAGHTI